MPRTAWTSSRRVPDISSGVRSGGGSAVVVTGAGAVVVTVPDVIAVIGAEVAGGSSGGAEVDGSGGGDGGSDMIGLVSLDTKLVGLGFLPGLRRRLYGQGGGGRGLERARRRWGAVAARVRCGG